MRLPKKAEEDEKQRKLDKAEEKKKRKEKKKKKKEEEAKESGGSAKKKGIPSLKSRESVEQEQPLDDVDAVALALASGAQGGDEDFEGLFDGDDMFDFGDEDITGLL